MTGPWQPLWRENSGLIQFLVAGKWSSALQEAGIDENPSGIENHSGDGIEILPCLIFNCVDFNSPRKKLPGKGCTTPSAALMVSLQSFDPLFLAVGGF